MMRTSNPTLNDRVFANAPAAVGGETMTVNGAVNKTFFLTILLVLSAGTCWNIASSNPALMSPIMWVSIILGFVTVIVSSFKPVWSPVLGPIYGVVEGGFVGVISYMYNSAFDGIVMQAALITVGILFALLFAYKSGLIKATENFKLGIVAATGGIALVYLATIILGFFGVQIPFIHGSGMIGIGFSLFVVVIASLNLVLDFDFIENGAASGAPKYMEWQAAIGLLVTLVWLYVEVLRLLSKLQSRD